MKKSKVQSFTMQDSWSNVHGTYWPHDVKFENGDEVTFNKKSQNAYAMGEEVVYTTTPTDYGLKGKQHKLEDFQAPGAAPQSKGKSFDGTGAMVGNAITNAISMYNADKIGWDKVEASANEICEISKRLKTKHS